MTTCELDGSKHHKGRILLFNAPLKHKLGINGIMGIRKVHQVASWFSVIVDVVGVSISFIRYFACEHLCDHLCHYHYIGRMMYSTSLGGKYGDMHQYQAWRKAEEFNFYSWEGRCISIICEETLCAFIIHAGTSKFFIAYWHWH
eukprot:Gb_23045 [translate_table: standard]